MSSIAAFRVSIFFSFIREGIYFGKEERTYDDLPDIQFGKEERTFDDLPNNFYPVST